MNEQMTLKQVLIVTLDILNGINVPVAFHHQIGDPISAAAGNLVELLNTIDKAEKAANDEKSEASYADP